MKPNEQIKVGDSVFGVDPQKLVIVRANVVEVNGSLGHVSHNHPHKSLNEKLKALIKIAIDKFPCEHNGIIFFKTEEDAQKYVKTQIGT
jgi:hypothetical protein